MKGLKNQDCQKGKLRASVTSGKVQHCILSHGTLFVAPVASGTPAVWRAARRENLIRLTWGQKKLCYTHSKMEKHSWRNLLIEHLSLYSLFLNCTWLKCRLKHIPAWHIDGVLLFIILVFFSWKYCFSYEKTVVGLVPLHI